MATARHSYTLRKLHFSGLASMAVPLWYGGDDSFEVQTDRNHRLDFELSDARDGDDYLFEAFAYNREKDYEPMAGLVTCRKVEGLQIMATIYDEYALDCALAGKRPVPQDKATLAAMRSANVRHKQQDRLPYVLVTQKLILPDFGLKGKKLRHIGQVNDALDDYYDSYSRDYSAMSGFWGAATDDKLAKYGREFTDPIQFVAAMDEKRNGYQLFVIEPFGYVELDYIEDIDEVCTTLKALEAGYVLPAPQQPAVIQHWAQNVHDWDAQRGEQRLVRAADIGAALQNLRLDKLPPFRDKYGVVNKSPTLPILPN